MMENTINTGTARKAFRKHRNDKVLAPLQIGGKTGSLDSASHDVRYDWFVGFARERHGEKQLVVAVMVAHEKFLGIRASDYARRAMTYYFGNPPTKNTPILSRQRTM
jgi:cell division protein FtsI/penicillin-binding protein 2